MAKEKTVHPLNNGSYGKITKKEASGMFTTNKGHKIPPFPALKIGDEVIMEDGHYKIGDGIGDFATDESTPTMAEFKQMKEQMAQLTKQNKALEDKMGIKGSGVRT